MTTKDGMCSATGSCGPFFALLTCLVLIISLVAPWFVVIQRNDVSPEPGKPFAYAGESVTLYSWNDAFCYDKDGRTNNYDMCPLGTHYAWRKADWCQSQDCSHISTLFWASLGLISVSIILAIASAVAIFRRCCSIKSAPGRSKLLIGASIVGFITMTVAVVVYSVMLPKTLGDSSLPICTLAITQRQYTSPCNKLYGSLTLLDGQTQTKFTWLPGGWIAGVVGSALWLFVIYFAFKPVPEPEFKHAQYHDMSRPMLDQSNVADYYYY